MHCAEWNVCPCACLAVGRGLPLWAVGTSHLHSCEHPRCGHAEVEVSQRVWVGRLVDLGRPFLWQIIWGTSKAVSISALEGKATSCEGPGQVGADLCPGWGATSARPRLQLPPWTAAAYR